MKKVGDIEKREVAFLEVLRFVFVVFILYLVGDAFYRWDGFMYYASFSEFLPAIALVSILWSAVAVFATVLVWLPSKVFAWFCHCLGWKARIEHLLVFTGTAVLLGAIVLIYEQTIKGYMLNHVQNTYQLKIILLFAVIFVAIVLTVLFRNKVERWTGIIQEHITPLVWLFGIWIALSVPLVVYTCWFSGADVEESRVVKNISESRRDRPDIILVTFDAMTARDMSVYGYHRPTTPFIDKWAKAASLFTRAKSESSATTPTTASLLTGKRIWTHRTIHQKGSVPLRAQIESLPAMLKKNGYYNMAFVVNPYAAIKTLGMTGSFDVVPSTAEFRVSASNSVLNLSVVDKLLYRLFSDKIKLYDWILKSDFILNKFLHKVSLNYRQTTYPPDRAFNMFLQVIDHNSPSPYFSWIHLFPPHDPYLPPEPFMGMFDSSPDLRTLKDLERKYTNRFSFTDAEQPEIDTFRARYDEFIRYCDMQFKEFIDDLAQRKKLQNTVIILSADHGESFEHNQLSHDTILYDQVTHIPLIIKEADQENGRVINDLVEQIDIPATILDLAGISLPSWMEGRSLVPLLRGGEIESRPAFSGFFSNNPSNAEITRGKIAVWEGDDKLIHYLEEDESLLFDLKKDPGELSNLFEKEPDTGRRLLGLILDNLEKANERIRGGM